MSSQNDENYNGDDDPGTKEPPYSSPTSYPPKNYDPLVIDQGFPLDEHGFNLPEDFIAPVVIPYYFGYGPNSGVVNTTEYSPVTPGLTKSDGPTPASEYPGIPGFAARLDLTTGLRTEYSTAYVFAPFDWYRYVFTVVYGRMQLLSLNRDQTSDILNLWGTKPHFVDDWFDLVRDTRPPNPRVAW